MNPVYDVHADIVTTMEKVFAGGYDALAFRKEHDRLQKRIDNLKLVRDRYATNTLLTSMIGNVMMKKLCLAYEFEKTLYCTANNVPGRPNTDFLHSLNLSSAEWDALPQYHVWIASGKIYSTVHKSK
ncbi:hypothetical protein GAP32_014 [Cronobacter phage vB_CsaM_GAP32]|uniref:Uncharacterized protein n=1 Tax=Cronobacter phage vB_CsaM_GAP32 TaxID=1141136 RepID=K4F5J4_9CAUD|nr:hypothetical protein GAP32_014 [Cronobacter phage vB_CsaM_GAP32]AFC21461.1 hypothetical protein GAP32_014 [Cronobacter phage vB_CsaM_GAP32]